MGATDLLQVTVEDLLPGDPRSTRGQQQPPAGERGKGAPGSRDKGPITSVA